MAPAHTHIVVKGTLPGGEIFSFGWDLAGNPADTTALAAVLDNASNALTASGTPKSTLQSMITTSASYDTMTGYVYPTGATAASFQAVKNLNVAGTGITGHPNQTALAVSKLSATSGRRGRGRMFLPANACGFAASTGLLSAPTLANVLDAAKALINAATSLGGPVVISQAANAAYPITVLSMDPRPDVIRGRAGRQVTGARISVTL